MNKKKYLPIYVVLLSAILIFGLLISIFISKNQELGESIFEAKAQKFKNLFEIKINQSLNLLTALEGFYKASSYVDRNEFELFSLVLSEGLNYEAVQWLPIIKSEQRASFEKEAHETGRAEYSILKHSKNSGLIKSEDLKSYVPVYYSRPYDSFTENYLGLDWYQIPERKNALEKSLETEFAVEHFKDIEGFSNSTLAIIKSVTSNKSSMNEVYGFLIEFIDIEKLLTEVNNEFPDLSVNFHCPLKDRLLVECVGTEEVPAARYSSSQEVEFGNRVYNLHIYPNENYLHHSILFELVLFSLLYFIAVFYICKYLKENIDQAEIIDRTVKIKTADLQNSNEELDRFAYIISHDLKEPIRGISQYSELLAKKIQGLEDESSKKLLQTIKELCKKSYDLLNSVYLYSKLDKVDLAYKVTNINETVKDVIASLSTYIEEHGASVIIPQELPEIYCDSIRVGEVFRNLITNAIKYNSKEHKFVEIGFNKGKNDIIEFYVKDNGDGIKQDYFTQIFELFKRLDPETKGSGVGLSLVKKIIEKHKGSIRVESKPDEGSYFYFNFGRDSVALGSLNVDKINSSAI